MVLAGGLSLGIPLLAAAACALSAWHRPGRARLAWALLALGALGWAAVGAVRLSFGPDALPFAAFDLQFAVAVGPAIIALALLPGPPPLFPDRLRTVFDGAVVAAALLFISWATGLGLAYRNAAGDLNSRLNALAHPFGDLVVAVMVTFVLYGAIRTATLSRLLLGLGLLVNVVSDSAVSWSQFRPTDGTLGTALSWAWVLGYALVAAAALADWRERRRLKIARRTLGAAASILYLPLLGTLAVAAWQELLGQPADAFLFWNGLVLVALIVAREVHTLVTNRRLRRSFDERLAARTQELGRSEARYRALVDHSAEPVLLVDQQGIIHYESASIERVLGRVPGSNKDRRWQELVHPDDQQRVQFVIEKSRQAPGVPIVLEARVSHGDEGWRQAELIVTNQVDEPAVGKVVLNLRDITDQKALENQLSRHALYDPVTALANRALFWDRLHQSVSRAARRPEQPAVLLIDIDGIRNISQALGNKAADDVMGAVADRLRECVRAGDTIGRFGNDEFAILLEDTQNEGAPARVAERVRSELARVRIGDASTPLTAGIGIAAFSPGLQNPDDLLRHADTALAEAKSAGADKIAIYDRKMTPAITSQMELESDLQQAIERKEFVVHYQPIVRLEDEQPTAVEALVRWVHPWRGMLLPADFILAADKTGAIVSLGRWLLLEASQQVRRWQEKFQLPTLGLAVNLSMRQLNDPGLANDIRHVIAETGLQPSLLMLEMREPALLEDLAQSATILGKLKDLGTSLAIDDCQSGATALGYARHLPVDTIKIDRAFIMNLGKERERTQVQGMIGAGNSLKMAMVAEGIEEASQAAELIKMGCELGQGFHFAKPLAASQMFDYLDKQCRARAA